MNAPDTLPFSDPTQTLPGATPVLAGLTALAGCQRPVELQQRLVSWLAELSGCALVQFYLLDASHSQLPLCCQWLNGVLGSAPERDGLGESLLGYSLSQNAPLHLNELDRSLHSTPFLPAVSTPWRSLLCQPLVDCRQQVVGLLVLASQGRAISEALAPQLAMIGTIALAQLQALHQTDLAQHTPCLTAPDAMPQSEHGNFGLIGESPAMQGVYRLVSKVLHNPVTVLLGGETGTGKELVARAIHDYGSRRTQPFIAQNCSALPEQLLESELFGYRKGAFTGANQDRDGLFDAASGGTLFLDEIGDMPLALQAKLLRVLQEGEVRPLGSNQSHHVDVRIIAATHQNLFDQVEQGRFREDLYYRLSHFPITLPPLRERGTDIRQLALHFSRETCSFLQRSDCRWSDSALAYLASHRFPGNVRELKGLIARALLLCDGNLILPEHLHLPNTPTHAHRLTLREQLDQVERNLLNEALQRHNGNQSLTAQVLGLPRRTLLYRMQRLGVPLRSQRHPETAPK
ncbi:MAG: sigma 54-interacting transcriptional regulator [Pseudomonadaceae bacterium]